MKKDHIVMSQNYLVLPILPHLLRKAENIRTNAPKAASYDVLSDRSFFRNVQLSGTEGISDDFSSPVAG